MSQLQHEWNISFRHTIALYKYNLFVFSFRLRNVFTQQPSNTMGSFYTSTNKKAQQKANGQYVCNLQIQATKTLLFVFNCYIVPFYSILCYILHQRAITSNIFHSLCNLLHFLNKACRLPSDNGNTNATNPKTVFEEIDLYKYMLPDKCISLQNKIKSNGQ